MRSKHADAFNHDEYAAEYDADVANEADPLRTGYRAALDWIARVTEGASPVLDLGCGTGNEILGLPATTDIVAVDISQKMLAVARKKLEGRHVTFVTADILEYVGRPVRDAVGAVISAYALHHLMESEKSCLLARLKDLVAAGGHVAIVDLMYRNPEHREELLSRHSREWRQVSESIMEEFYWDIEWTETELARNGYAYTLQQFSELSWGIDMRPPQGGCLPEGARQGQAGRPRGKPSRQRVPGHARTILKEP
jgi:putative AdoMet-dependent methyltransferase